MAVTAREGAHEARLSQPCQGVAQLRLKDDDGGERAISEDHAEQRADHRKLREYGDEVGQREDHEADHDLQRPGPDEKEQEPVDDERDQQDLEQIRPEPRGEELKGVDVHVGLVVAPASARASRVIATS